MGLVPGLIRVGLACLRLYSFGSVCSHPDHRGKGYAGLLLEQALNHIDRADASLLLVSEDRSLYRRAGCLPFGSVKRYEITSNFLFPSRYPILPGSFLCSLFLYNKEMRLYGSKLWLKLKKYMVIRMVLND
jgi:GNAT superfamily N-acetyltransferase